ncbi:hypothetical protein D3C76_1756570 [compost metagenome]
MKQVFESPMPHSRIPSPSGSVQEQQMQRLALCQSIPEYLSLPARLYPPKLDLAPPVQYL